MHEKYAGIQLNKKLIFLNLKIVKKNIVAPKQVVSNSQKRLF